MTRQSTGLLALALVTLTVLAGPAATLDGMGVATAAGNTALAAGNTAAGTGTTTADAADAEWRTPLEGSVAATPTVVDGTAYLANGTSLTAVTVANGTVAWSLDVDSRVYGSPAVAGETVVAVTSEGTVYVVDAHTGTLRWRDSIPGPTYASPTIANGSLFVASNDATLYRYSLTAPYPTAMVALGAPASTSGPVYTDGIVFVGDRAGTFYALEAGTLETAWTATLDGKVTAPTVVAGTVAVGTANGTVVGYDASTTKRRTWSRSFDSGVYTPPTASGWQVVAATANGTVASLGVTNGSTQWVRSVASDRAVGSVTAAAGSLVVASTDAETLAILNRTTGDRIDAHRLGPAPLSGPALRGDRIVLGDANGTVLAVERPHTEAGASVPGGRNWSSVGGTHRNAGTIATPGALSRPLQPDWRATRSGSIVGQAAIVDGTAYAVFGSNLTAVTTNGSIRWSTALDARAYGTPAVTDDTAFVADAAGTVYGVNATDGSIRWRDSTPGPTYSSVTVADGSLYVASNDGTLYRYGTDGTTPTATYDLGAAASTSTPAVAGRIVYVGDRSGTLHAVAREGLEPLWTATHESKLTSPAVAGNTLAVGTANGTVAAYDAGPSRHRRWSRHLDGGVFEAPATDGEQIVAGTVAGSIHSLDATTGATTWNVTAPTATALGSDLALAGDVVVASTDAGTVSIRDRTTGERIDRLDPGGSVLGGVALADDRLLVGNETGTMTAYLAETMLVSDLRAAETTIAPDEPVIVTAVIENAGVAQHTYDVTLEDNGTTLATTRATVGTSNATTVRFNVTLSTDGSHTLAVGQEAVTVTVTDPATTTTVTTGTNTTTRTTTRTPLPTRTTTARPTDVPTTTTATDGSGLGIGVAVLALLAVTLASVRRRAR